MPARSGRVRAFLSLGMVLGLGAVSTLASWSDSATIQGGSFTTGTLDLKVGDPAVDNNPPQFATNFTMSNMVPGSSKDAILKISNVGTVPFNFTGTASATNNGPGVDQLGSVLNLTAYATHSAGACTGAAISSGTTSATFALVHPSPLAATATQEVCFRATLPLTADIALQGKTSVITVTLTAKQLP